MEVKRLSEKLEWSSLAGVFVDVIHFLFVFTVPAWSTQEFTVPVALWSFWWVPDSPQELSHVNVKPHLCSGALCSGGHWNRNQRIFEGCCCDVGCAGPWGGWGPSSALNFRWAQPCCWWKGSCSRGRAGLISHICHSYAYWGRVFLSLWYPVKILFRCHVFPWSFLSHNHQLARCVCARRFFLSNELIPNAPWIQCHKWVLSNLSLLVCLLCARGTAPDKSTQTQLCF